jgi:hypothetical protein
MMMRTNELVTRAAVGAATFLLVQIALFAAAGGVQRGADSPGWFLNSGGNAALVAIAIVICGVVVSAMAPAPILETTAAIGAGAIVALTATLFALGGSNLFPIVIAFGAVILAAAAAAGTVVGAQLARLRR